MIITPHQPKHPCSHPGCPALTHDQYCVTHAAIHAKHYEQYERDPNTWKRYGSAWRKVRAAYLSEHPLCEMCEKESKLVPAEHVHHIVEVSEGGSNDWSNLCAICKSHHSSLHISERNKRRV